MPEQAESQPKDYMAEWREAIANDRERGEEHTFFERQRDSLLANLEPSEIVQLVNEHTDGPVRRALEFSKFGVECLERTAGEELSGHEWGEAAQTFLGLADSALKTHAAAKRMRKRYTPQAA